MTSCAAAGSAARLALIQDGKPFMLVTGENTPSLSRTARSTSAATSRPMNMRWMSFQTPHHRIGGWRGCPPRRPKAGWKVVP